MNHKVIFLDTETTSLDTECCGLIQISGIIDIDGKTVDEFNLLSDIFKEDIVNQEALSKNGKTLDSIHTQHHPFKTFSALQRILGKYVDKYDKIDKYIAIAYVADFDNRVLRSFFRKNGDQYFGSWFWHPWIDIMNLAAFVYQDTRKDFENFKMITVAKKLGIEIAEDQCHNGLYDVKKAREIYYMLL
jgi:DNA polymerase-3 subunit epsilon